jgi:hypothetical protein
VLHGGSLEGAPAGATMVPGAPSDRK